MRNESEVVRALARYADTLRRICFIHLKNRADVEDVFQEVFLKYALSERVFESGDHEKAWLIRVAVNQCKDVIRGAFRRRVTSLDDMENEPSYQPDESGKEVLDAIFRLPDRYRDVIYLYYYEGYHAGEIAKILGKKIPTVYTWLTRSREQLKRTLGGETFEQ